MADAAAARKTTTGAKKAPAKKAAAKKAPATGKPRAPRKAAAKPVATGKPAVAKPVAVRTVDAVKVYGEGDTEVVALRGVNVTFARQEFTAIMGPSGSGKSTLMHCLAGLDSLTSGQVFIGDAELGTMNETQLTQLRRDQVGFVFQAFNLVPTLTAIENITLPADLAGRKPDPSLIERIVATMGLGDRLKHRPRELSGGQQQRVAVARALANRPQVVFADEPTGNLDSATSAEILEFLRSATSEFDQTIVIVTHDPVAASYADRVVFLDDGQTVDEMANPTPANVLERMKAFRS
jgi:putative ABC transport system ATP-binding protein